MNHKKIKEETKKMLEGNLWVIWKPYLMVYLISMLLGIFMGILFTDNNTYNIISSLSEILLLPMSVGCVYYILKFVRKEKVEVNDIYSYYNLKSFILIFGVSFLVGIFTILWSCLFIIPGIIAALSYSMVYYILVDNKELSPMDLIRKSKRLMKGHKWDYFVFMLSFIGWILLCMLIVPVIYVYPYISVSSALYYEELKKLNVNNL